MPINILVADDDKAIIGLYNRIFSATDYSVSKAETFDEAFGMIRARDYDLLITDLVFPDGIGTELVRLFNEVKKKPSAKCLIVSGSLGEKEKISYEGVHCVIAKPFKVERLMEAVEDALA